MKKYIRIYTLFLFLMSFVWAQDLTGLKFCFDPGHGGHESDDRNMTFANFWESESNLSKAFHVRNIFQNLGATVILTRYANENDVTDDPSLSERAAIANQNGVDFFQSIHSNGWNGERNSTLMLYPGPTGDPRINGISGYPSCPIELTCSNIMVNQIRSSNRTTGTQTAGDWTFYGTGQPYLGVFRTLTLPGVLSEGSYHDYRPETWRLKNRYYHRNEAYAIARSFVMLLDSSDFQYSTLAGIARDSFEKVDYYYISGTKDNYVPVNNITVTLNPDGKVYHGDSFNNGYFFFDSLSAGAYQLIVEADGYVTDTAEVTIEGNFFNFKDFSLFQDIPPYVVSTVPAEADTNVPAWDPIRIVFNHPMDTIQTASKVSISPAAPLQLEWSSDLKTLTVSSDSISFLTQYTLTISSALQNIIGYSLDGNNDGIGGDDFVLTFTTGPEDMEAPQMLSSYPLDGAQNLELNPVINLTFNEMIDTTLFDESMIYLYRYPDNVVIPSVIKHFYVNDQSVFNLFPLEVLNAATIYKIRIVAGLSDNFGNTVTTDDLIRFKTGTNAWIVNNVDTFDSGLISNWWSPQSSGSTAGVDAATARSENAVITNLSTGSTKSMQLDYDWDLSASSWLIRVVYKSGSSTQNIYFGQNSALQVYIFGDGSGNQFRFAVDEVSGSSASEVSKWFTIDWIGWKLVQWNYDDPSEVGSWIGNGVLDGTSYRFDSIHMTYTPEAAETGTVYFDDLRVVSIEAVNEIEEPVIADKFALQQNYPNPFNPTTSIVFIIPEASNTQLDIYNVRGEKVRSLVNGYYQKGRYTVVWDGKNDSGNLVPSGIYMYRMISGAETQVRTMLMMK